MAAIKAIFKKIIKIIKMNIVRIRIYSDLTSLCHSDNAYFSRLPRKIAKKLLNLKAEIRA
ncbi:hypothetical protein CBF17_000920 [Pantoea agglomerans]|nr:hypothetical protein CBF17_000920 [Pantoea agglomerans]